MFGLGFGEIVVILVIALLVFGPDKLPDIARTLGRTMAEFRRSVDQFKFELNSPRADLERELLQGPNEAPKPEDKKPAAVSSEPISEPNSKSE